MATQRGKSWRVSLRYNGDLVRKTFPTQLEAETWEAKAQDAKRNGLPLPDVAGSSRASTEYLGPFISQMYDDIWGSNKSQRIYRQYVKELQDFFGKDMKLSAITTREVDRFLNHCRDKGNSDKTLNRKISVLSKLLKKALAREDIHKLPVLQRRKEGQGRKRFLSDDEEQDIISTLWQQGEEQASKRVQFMLYTGARDGEVRNLAWSDVVGNKVTLEGKTGHRTIVLPVKAKEALEWSKKQGHNRPFPMSYTSFKEAWDKAAVILGKTEDPQWVPYVLRHTCASRLVQRGVDLRRVKDWMGHSTITTTMIYAHLAPDDLEQCAEALDA